MWLTTFVFIFVMGGLSFTKTVISKIVSSSLSEEEAASGMSLLNFTSFFIRGNRYSNCRRFIVTTID